MKKTLALVLALCMVLTMALATAAAEENITLRFSWWGGDARHEATMKVIEQYEALHPNVTIEPEYGSSDGYNDKLATQLAGGTAPDIIQIDPAFLPSYALSEAGYLVDLMTAGFDFSLMDPAYYTLRMNGGFDGKQYGVPTGVSGAAILVNNEMAEKFGIDFNTQYTWDDVFAWAKQVHEADPSVYLFESNKTMLAACGSTVWSKQNFDGKTFFDVDAKAVNYTVEELTEVFAFIKRLFDEGVVAPVSYMAAYEGDNMQNDPNWIAGDKYVACLAYTSTCETLAAAAPNNTFSAGKFPLSAGSDIAAWNSNCPQVMAVNAKSQHVEAAVDFLNYFFNDETAMVTLGSVRSVPPTSRARELCAEQGLISPLLAQACDVCTSYSGIPDDSLYNGSEAKQIMWDAIEEIGYGAATPEQVAQNVYDLWTDYAASK
ncbi:MAG: ABC transporter substrate-binding protein [Candidatus Ventricola sp.]